MKKLVSLFLALVLITGLCLPAAMAETTTVKVFAWGNGAEMDSHKLKVALFNESALSKELGITAEIEVVPGGEYNTKLNAMLSASTAPDIIMESADFNGFYYRTGNFADLSAYVERDGLMLEDILVPGLDVGNVHNGYREALPFTGNSMVIAYNKDLFDAMGVAYPTADWTWEDFFAICDALTTGEGAAKQYAICDHWATRLLASYAAGGQLYDLTQTPAVMTATDPKTVEGVKMFTDLISAGYMPDNLASQALPSEARFFAGMAGMIFFFTWDTQNFVNSIDGAFAWDVAEIPSNADGSKYTLSWTTGYAINQASANPDAAWEVLKFLCLSPEANAQNAAVGIPALQSMTEEYSAQMIPGTDISLGIFMDVFKYGKINPVGGSFSAIADVYYRNWDEILLNGVAVTDAMAAVQEECTPILNDLMNPAQ